MAVRGGECAFANAEGSSSPHQRNVPPLDVAGDRDAGSHGQDASQIALHDTKGEKKPGEEWNPGERGKTTHANPPLTASTRRGQSWNEEELPGGRQPGSTAMG